MVAVYIALYLNLFEWSAVTLFRISFLKIFPVYTFL